MAPPYLLKSKVAVEKTAMLLFQFGMEIQIQNQKSRTGGR